MKQSMDHTTIELMGTDRPGLLSELSAVLTHLKCNIVDAEVWTHNARAAAVMHVTDEETGSAITDPQRLSVIKELLCNLLGSCGNINGRAKTTVTDEVTHVDRRLHQMMFADRDYESDDDVEDEDDSEFEGKQKQRPDVNVVNCTEKDYSIVTIQSKDRPKLVFDIVCTLTDMDYVVFHASINAEAPEAYQVTTHSKSLLPKRRTVRFNVYYIRLIFLDFSAGILHQTYRWITCEIRCRKTKIDTMS